jgi:hypothetical protein
MPGFTCLESLLVNEAKERIMTAASRKRGNPKDSPVVVEYYYKIKWGYHDEFIELFKRNHYPLLAAQVESGRFLRFEAYSPRFHGDGRSDWNFVTIIVYKDWQALGARTSKALVRRLYPDQERFEREERRRFELVEAHWDVPLSPVTMG